MLGLAAGRAAFGAWATLAGRPLPLWLPLRLPPFGAANVTVQNAAQAIPTNASFTKFLFIAHLHFLFYGFDGEPISPLHQVRQPWRTFLTKPPAKISEGLPGVLLEFTHFLSAEMYRIPENKG